MISTSSFFDLGIFTYVWNKLFKREVLYHAQMSIDNRISIGEDAACVYPALLSCKRIVVTSNCSYYYRQLKILCSRKVLRLRKRPHT